MEGFVDFALRFTYVLMIVGTLAAIFMPLIQAIMNDPKSLVKVLIGVGFILVIYGIGYALAGSEVTPKYTEFDVDASRSKMVGGLIYSMYLLMFLAIGGILYTEVSKVAK